MQHFRGVDLSGYDCDAWRPNHMTTTSTESEAESKIVREVIAAVTVDWQPDEMNFTDILNGMIHEKPFESAPGS